MKQRIRHIFHMYHPAVILLYSVIVLSLTMATLQPVYLAISLLIAVIYGTYLGGWQRFRKILLFASLPALLIVLLNPLFGSGGATVLFYWGRRSVTREAIFYGLATGGMLLTVLLWFFCWQKLINQEKFMYLFGRIFPTLALMLSMIFRLLPITRSKALQISHAQQAALPPLVGWRDRLHRQTRTISILMSWTMEDSIETADAMRARGYGQHKRSSYLFFLWRNSDTVLTVVLILLLILDVWGLWLNSFQYYPRIQGSLLNWPQAALYPIHALLLGLPLLLEAWETIRWK